MFCPNCGSEVADNARFCTTCGAKQTPQEAGAAPQPAQTDLQVHQAPQQMLPVAQPGQGGGHTPPPGASAASGEVDGGHAFTFFTKDPNWITKTIIGGLIILIPLIGTFVLMGFMLRIVKNTAEGRELPLPEWAFGEMLKSGFMVFVYMLGFMLITIFPLTIISGMIPLIGALIGIAGNFAVAVYLLVAASIVGAEENYAAVFQFKRVFEIIKNNVSTVAMVFLFTIGAYVVGCLGIIALGIGVLFTSVISTMIMGNLQGQLYRAVRE